MADTNDTLDLQPVTPEQAIPTAPASSMAEPIDLQPVAPADYEAPLSEQLKSGAEAAASAATMGLSTEVEKDVFEVPGKNIERRQQMEVPQLVGSIAGLMGSALLEDSPMSAAGLLSKAGQAAEDLVGLGAASPMARIGSAAVRNATEAAIFQSGNEISKGFAQDSPYTATSAQAALANVGMASLFGSALGAGLGTVGEGWKATFGGKLTSFLGNLSDRANGAPVNAAAAAGVELPPEVEAALDPKTRTMAGDLLRSKDTTSARAFTAKVDEAKESMGDSALSALGVDPVEAKSAPQLSKAEYGKALGTELAQSVDAPLRPWSAVYDRVKEQYGDVPVTAQARADLGTRLAQVAEEQQWLPSSPQRETLNQVLKDLPELTNLNKVNAFQSLINDKFGIAKSPEMYRAANVLKSAVREAHDNILDGAVGQAEGDVAQTALRTARQHFATEAQYQDFLNDRLHLPHNSISGYGKEIQGMALENPERLLQRLTGTNDSALLDMLRSRFPNAADVLKQYHTSNLIDQAIAKRPAGQPINLDTVLRGFSKMSPELKAFAFPQGASERVSAIKQVLEGLELAKKSSKPKFPLSLPTSAMAMASFLMGHGALKTLILYPLAKALGREAPDAAKLMMLKFMGSGNPLSAEGFAAGHSFMDSALKGGEAISKAAKAVFDTSKAVVPSGYVDDKEVKTLDKQTKALQSDPQAMLNLTGQLGHYLPGAATALSATAQNALTYINAQRPGPAQGGMLDRPLPPPPEKVAAFGRTLKIAQNPLQAFHYLKEGTLSPKDVQDFKAIYPDLSAHMTSQLTNEMMAHMSKDKPIPAKIRMGLSALLGQPVDSSLTPGAIMAAQASFPVPQPPSPGPGRPKGSKNKLGPSTQLAQTPGEARESALHKA